MLYYRLVDDLHLARIMFSAANVIICHASNLLAGKRDRQFLDVQLLSEEYMTHRNCAMSAIKILMNRDGVLI
jgi:hypothetical protein